MENEEQNKVFEGTLEQFIKEKSEILHIPPEIYLKIIQASFSQSSQDIEDLGKAIESGNYTEIKSFAHRLKGVYANLRIEKISELAEKIDTLAKDQGNIEQMKESFTKLSCIFKVVVEKFKK